MKTTKSIEIPYTQDELWQMFHYDPSTGILKWRKRPVTHFKSKRIWKMINTKYADKEICSSSDSKKKVGINGVNYLVCRIVYKMIKNEEPNEIYHINGNQKDIRWMNLLNLTHGQVTVLNGRLK
jgi:hypothetical protein